MKFQLIVFIDKSNSQLYFWSIFTGLLWQQLISGKYSIYWILFVDYCQRNGYVMYHGGR